MDDAASPALPIQHIDPTATAAFLLRCARSPGRWFYPANAKARDPVCCAFQFRVRGRPAATEVRVNECAYTEGGTGWRVWPCSLLLACWLAAHAAELQMSALRSLELIERYRIDESAQAITGAFLNDDPGVNLMSQPIHTHTLVLGGR